MKVLPEKVTVQCTAHIAIAQNETKSHFLTAAMKWLSRSFFFFSRRLSQADFSHFFQTHFFRRGGGGDGGKIWEIVVYATKAPFFRFNCTWIIIILPQIVLAARATYMRPNVLFEKEDKSHTALLKRERCTHKAASVRYTFRDSKWRNFSLFRVLWISYLCIEHKTK